MRKALTLLSLSIMALVTALGVGPAEAASCGEGDLIGPGDHDLWQLRVTPGWWYKVTLYGPPEADDDLPLATDFNLYIYDSCQRDWWGKWQCFGLRGKSTGRGSYEVVVFYASPSYGPIYYAKVVSYRGSGPYTICLQ